MRDKDKKNRERTRKQKANTNVQRNVITYNYKTRQSNKSTHKTKCALLISQTSTFVVSELPGFSFPYSCTARVASPLPVVNPRPQVMPWF